jgi:hypothetical protein
VLSKVRWVAAIRGGTGEQTSDGFARMVKITGREGGSRLWPGGRRLAADVSGLVLQFELTHEFLQFAAAAIHFFRTHGGFFHFP